jgi:hypothetical protein
VRCLEKGCSDAIFGAITGALVGMPATALVPFVVDAERVFPAYADTENPIRVIRRSTFPDFLKEIGPRLAALERVESEPKLIPKIFHSWMDA